MSELQFPKGFLWGAATSAHQIEGSPLADGAGPSNWYRFEHTPGNTAFGETADIACDHYNRWAEDVELMHDLGLNAYRFSVSWSRVFPEGRGPLNRRGLDFYERLVDALLERDITPNVTLYHWDLPAALDDRGGWLNPDVAHWFTDYASAMYRALGDRVPMWATLNEPWVVMDAGYVHGTHAPGHRSHFEAPIVAHNLLRAHGQAVQAFRSEARTGAIGIVVNLEPKVPATDRAEDIAAARRAEAYMNRLFLEPVVHGRYPAELAEIFGEAWPSHSDEDMALIREPLDYIGINYYKRGVTRHDDGAPPVRASLVRQPQNPHTVLGWEWEVYPSALTDVLLWVRQHYGEMPLYITENGSAFYDPPTARDDAVHDPLRVQYLRDHLLAVHAAIEQGVDVRGYFVWSLLDNFEWAAGYGPRFGIVHVDFETQKRTPKTSARYYTEIIRSNGGALAHAGRGS
jgi:beta-glucosidase|uniref:beta-glucosidase n=1 Tax=uncultured microorganism TaxID=358574 RepID=A0A3B1EZ56_9ZZZZ|nr:beta-glycosidase [uncultured microorganism]